MLDVYLIHIFIKVVNIVPKYHQIDKDVSKQAAFCCSLLLRTCNF